MKNTESVAVATLFFVLLYSLFFKIDWLLNGILSTATKLSRSIATAINGCRKHIHGGIRGKN